MKLKSSTLFLGLLLHLSSPVSATTVFTAPSSFRESMKQAGRDTTANEILDSILTGPKVRWRRADLVPRLRHRIHLNAAEVPRFPYDDPKLIDPRNWPASMIVEGKLCSLTVYAYDGRQATWSRSIEDSGAIVFDLYYTDVGTDFHSHYARHRGPFYDWLKGRLRQRSWAKGRGRHSRIRSYWPYPSGELFKFMEFDKKYDAMGNEVSIEWTEEVFARDGTLIGCSEGDGLPARNGYWLGVDVGKDYVYRSMEALERSLVRP